MYRMSAGVLHDFDIEDTTLVVPPILNRETVTVLGRINNQSKFRLTKLVIPKTVKKIYPSAFYNCPNLSEIIIEDGSELNIIQDSAFRSCKSLKRFPFEKTPNLNEIQADAFNKSGLVEADMSNTKISEIGLNGFVLSKLKTVKFPNTLSFIGTGAFSQTLLEAIDLSTVKDSCKVWQTAFFDTPINDIIFSKEKELCISGIEVFSFCPNLKNIVIPSTVKIIGGGCFEGCSSLETVHFLGGDGDRVLAPSTFSKCEKLYKVIIDFPFNRIREYAFSECVALKEIKLPASVKAISEDAFLNCKSLESVDLSDCNIEEIARSAFSGTNFKLDSFKMDFFSEARISKTSFNGNKNINMTEFSKKYPFCNIKS